MIRSPRSSRKTGPGARSCEASSLNPAQRKAVGILEGPVLVIAGAGTGKTLTLVHRLVQLVDSGVPAESVLLLTFTRRAAQEMIERASGLLEGKCDRVAGGTFHSFANLILRRYGSAIGLASDYTVLDQADTFEILSGVRSDLKLSERSRGFPRRATIAAILGKAVNKKRQIRRILKEEYPQFAHEASELNKIARVYTKYKKERRLLDFDDLLVHLIRLLEKSEETRTWIGEKYRYVMIDEYQDTNVLQARITSLLAGEMRNIMVVGDDAQSIYAFRGACYHNLFDFHGAFKDAKLITLEQNYRSTQPVLDLANTLMGQMSRSFRKRLFTRRQEGERPLLVEAANEEEQARFVAKEVQRLHKEGIGLSEVAVLFRAGHHAFGLELELESRGIAYVKYGGFRFLEAAHIKDVLAYLRVLANPDDDLSLIRILMLCEGIGRAGARKIQQAIAGRPVAEALQDYPARGKTQKSLGELARLMTALEASTASPSDRIRLIVDNVAPLLERRFDDWPKRQRDLEQLAALCEKYRSLEAMLTELTLEPPSSSSSQKVLAGQIDGDKLVLSTMHSAKGLEWKVVFIIQALDGCIPMVTGFGSEEEDEEKLDEERRLMYVAVTRARDVLYIVHPRETARGYGFGWADVSRFLEDVPENLLSTKKASQLLRARVKIRGGGKPRAIVRVVPKTGKGRVGKPRKLRLVVPRSEKGRASKS